MFGQKQLCMITVFATFYLSDLYVNLFPSKNLNLTPAGQDLHYQSTKIIVCHCNNNFDLILSK